MNKFHQSLNRSVQSLKTIFSTLIVLLFFGSCNKCYDCVKECGYCTKAGAPTLTGCQGDDALSGYSVATWKIALENQGYTCVYKNAEDEACGKSEKSAKESTDYTCVAK